MERATGSERGMEEYAPETWLDVIDSCIRLRVVMYLSLFRVVLSIIYLSLYEPLCIGC